MSFIEGRENISQWLALIINFNVFIFGITNRNWVLFLLSILLIVLYYTIREFYFFKNDPEDKMIAWNLGYFILSIILLVIFLNILIKKNSESLNQSQILN